MTPCKECGAKCCRYFCFPIDEPDDYEEFEDVRWYLCHKDVSVHIDEDGDWYMQVMNPCMFLDERRHRCTAYERRPLICRKYETDGCDLADGDYSYQEEFTSPEQLQEYARRTLGECEFEQQKKKARSP